MASPPNYRFRKCSKGLKDGDPYCECPSCEKCEHILFLNNVPDYCSVQCGKYDYIIDGHGWVICDDFKYDQI